MTKDEEVTELRERVKRLEGLVLLLCSGKTHDVSWLPHYYSRHFSPTADPVERLKQFEAAWAAQVGGEPATSPPGHRVVQTD